MLLSKPNTRSAVVAMNLPSRFLAILLVLGYWTCLDVIAQTQVGLDPDKRISQYIFDKWDRSDGLPFHLIRTIAQTSDGFIWVGTRFGLARFDGHVFRHITRADDREFAFADFSELLFQPSTGLWAATGNGLYLFANNQWKLMRSDKPFTNVSGMIEDGDQNLWITTRDQGVFRYSDGEFTNISQKHKLETNRINKVHWSAQTGLLLGTNGGLFRLRDGELQKIRGNPVYALGSTRDGTIWCGDFLNGLVRRSPGGKETIFASEVGIQASTITHVLEDSRGSVWVSFDNQGLFRLAGDTWSHFRETDGLPDDRAHVLFEDRDGALWIGTQNGLARLRDDLITVFTRREGMACDQHHAVAEAKDGVIWAGGTGGISAIYPDGRIEAITHFEDRQLGIIVGVLTSPTGRPWFATLGRGLLHMESGKLEVADLDMNNPYIHGFNWQADGSVWVSMDSGNLLHFTKSGIRNYSPDHGWHAVFANQIYESRSGDIWITTPSGIYKKEGSQLRHFGEDQGIRKGAALNIHEDNQGWLWFQMDGKLLVYDGKAFSHVVLPEIDASFQLSLTQDTFGFMWISSHYGLYRIARDVLLRRTKQPDAPLPMYRFGEGAGLKSSSFGFGQKAAIRAGDGRLWFATAKGVIVVDPSRVRPPPPLPLPALDQVIVNDINRDDATPFTLAPGQHRITANFTAIRFDESETLRFRYRLDPYDDQWIMANQTREATYTNLPPGDFSLRVAVRDEKSEWLESSEPLQFKIEPFFYQTSWFLPGLLGLFVLLTTLVYFWRTRRLKRQNRILEDMVANRTANLRQEKEKTTELYTQLQATHQEKVAELEEARALQLAMLPKKPPEIPGWTIATFLQTASEVGGDYYDFERSHEHWTVAVGDATGHGMKAGMFVAATKSHFQSFAHLEDPVAMARQISQNLKALKLKSMFMALTLAKPNGNTVDLLMAGMPPAFIYRMATQQVEIVTQKALPLGGFPNFPYRSDSLSFAKGDVLVLMSDGLPERFDPANQMLTESRVAGLIQQEGHRSPQDLLIQLFEAGETWGAGRPQDDDIAMVAMQFSGSS